MTDKSGHFLFLLDSCPLTSATHSAKSRGQVELTSTVCECVCGGGERGGHREQRSASVPYLSAGLHCTPGPKARPELWRNTVVASTSLCSQNIHTAHHTKPREQANKPQSNIIQHTHRVFAQGHSVYSRHIQCIYIHQLIERVSTYTTTHSSQEVQSRRTGPVSLLFPSSSLPVTVRWCGGFRPCVWHKGLLHAWRPTPTGRFYPAGSLPPGSRSESLTLTEAFPQCQSLTELNLACR